MRVVMFPPPPHRERVVGLVTVWFWSCTPLLGSVENVKHSRFKID